MHAVVKPQAVPFLDLAPEFRELEREWLDAIRSCGASGSFILGKNVTALEQEIAAYVGAAHAVAVANGTDALVLSLRACGIGAGDEVITTAFSFFATAEAITLVGATPVFVDIETDGFNLDVTQIKARIGAKTRAIMPVHLYGQPAAMDAVMAIANAHGLKVIEDCAQAFGARIGDARVGSIGDIGCFSFYPTKVLGCYGDGGMIVTRDEATARKLRALRNHGATQPGVHEDIGYNSRLDEIQAALLRLKLARIDAAIDGRRRVAHAYNDRLRDGFAVPSERPGTRHAYNVYTLRAGARDRVRQRLAERDIASAIFYTAPMHLQPAYKTLGYTAQSLPRARDAAGEVLSLPIFPTLSAEQIERVRAALLSAT